MRGFKQEEPGRFVRGCRKKTTSCNYIQNKQPNFNKGKLMHGDRFSRSERVFTAELQTQKGTHNMRA